ncbi:MAG TPA: Fe-S cluster assembly protein SufD [Bacteroidaceae bacterium]|nr:Fe-S cluster assembly protein SufD [Bacteroidaceae bacterium]
MNVAQQYIDLYEDQKGVITTHSSGVMNAPRELALESFVQQGIPTKGLERYRYTDLSHVFDIEYGVNLKTLLPNYNPYNDFSCDVDDIESSLHFLVNGVYQGASETPNLPDGMLVGSLRKLTEEYPEKFAPYYNKLAGEKNDPMACFNTAFAQDGLLVYVPRGVEYTEVLQLISLFRSQVDMLINRRLLIILEDQASMKMLLCDHVDNDITYLSTQTIEIYLGKGARLEMYDLEETHNETSRINNVYVQQEADSSFLMNGTTLHNGLSRNDIYVDMIGEGADVLLSGMVIADKKQHIDNHTFIRHAVPNCTSHELFKYILDNQAIGAFSGRVLVERDAQKTLSEQSNKNICLTKSARMYTQPQLEIYADDVKCSHGATVGQLDDQALFYMQQRGIPAKEARMLLMFAFVDDVINTIRIPVLQERLRKLVEQRLRGETNKCTGCALCGGRTCNK